MTEQCVVMVEGKMKGDKLEVEWMGLPPNVSSTPKKSSKTMAMFKDISDLAKFKSMMMQFGEAPQVVVLMGPFFEPSLISLLEAMDVYWHPTSIYVIPGPSDGPPLLPKIPLYVEPEWMLLQPTPTSTTTSNTNPNPTQPTSWTTRGGNQVLLASNPCIIEHCFIFREDLTQKMRRKSIWSSVGSHPSEGMAKTILSQGHVMSYPSEAVMWPYDHSFYFPEDIGHLVIADSGDAFEYHMDGFHVLSAGSFHDGSFLFSHPTQDTSIFHL